LIKSEDVTIMLLYALFICVEISARFREHGPWCKNPADATCC